MTNPPSTPRDTPEARTLAERPYDKPANYDQLEDGTLVSKDAAEVFQNDIADILDALGLGTHARPYSAHEVVWREVLPAIRRLAALGAQPDARASISDDTDAEIWNAIVEAIEGAPDGADPNRIADDVMQALSPHLAALAGAAQPAEVEGLRERLEQIHHAAETIAAGHGSHSTVARIRDDAEACLDALSALPAPARLKEAEEALERLDARRDEDIGEWAERLGSDLAATPSDDLTAAYMAGAADERKRRRIKTTASGERPTEIEIEQAMEAVHDRLNGAGAWGALDLSARVTMARTVAHLLNAQPTDRLAGKRAPAQPAPPLKRGELRPQKWDIDDEPTQPAREAEGLREPGVIYATVRVSDDEDWTDIECRFADGQKFVAVQVDSDFPALAHRIALALTAAAPAQTGTPGLVNVYHDGTLVAANARIRDRAGHFGYSVTSASPPTKPPPFVGYHGCCGRRLDLGHKPDCPSAGSADP